MKNLFLISIVNICFVSCSKNEGSDPAPANNVSDLTINSPCQFSCTIDGVNYSAIEGHSDYYSLSTHSIDSSTLPVKHFYYSVIGSSNLLLPKLTASKAYLYTNSGSPDTTAILDFYSPGNINYFNDSEGIFLSINQINNSELTSIPLHNSNANQFGSNFIIDHSIIGYDSLMQKYFIKVKASFNCKLYNWLDSVTTLTNGLAVFKVYPNL
jgi:hypothetical protein